MVLDIFVQKIIILLVTYPNLVPWFLNAQKVRYQVCQYIYTFWTSPSIFCIDIFR
jgi:hypothetical protein